MKIGLSPCSFLHWTLHYSYSYVGLRWKLFKREKNNRYLLNTEINFLLYTLLFLASQTFFSRLLFISYIETLILQEKTAVVSLQGDLQLIQDASTNHQIVTPLKSYKTIFSTNQLTIIHVIH